MSRRNYYYRQGVWDDEDLFLRRHSGDANQDSTNRSNNNNKKNNNGNYRKRVTIKQRPNQNQQDYYTRDGSHTTNPMIKNVDKKSCESKHDKNVQLESNKKDKSEECVIDSKEMESNNAKQTDEIEMLKSIYSENQIKEIGNNRQFEIRLRQDKKEFIFKFQMPKGYPSKLAPIYSIETNWLKVCL